MKNLKQTIQAGVDNIGDVFPLLMAILALLVAFSSPGHF